jgi:hypothetical protein
MKTLENTVKILTDVYHHVFVEPSLVVGIPHPRDCAQGTDDDSNVGDRPNNKDRVVVDRMLSEDVHDLEDKPASTG